MKDNVIDIALVILIASIFIGYFTFINLTVSKDMKNHLSLIEDYAREEDWNKVLKVSQDIKNLWNKHKYLIMFNFGELEFFDFDDHINAIIGGAEGKQLDTTLSNILSAQSLWGNLGKVTPEP